MKNTTSLLFLGLLVGCTGGSYSDDQSYSQDTYDSYETWEGEEEWWGEDEWVEGTNLGVESGHLRGDIGDLMRIDQQATLTGEIGQEWGTVSVIVEREDGAAMALFDVYGDLDSVPVGGSISSVRRNDDDPVVSVTGCSGEVTGTWDYDAPADNVEIMVSEGSLPGLKQVHFVAVWEEQGADYPARRVEGWFEFGTVALTTTFDPALPADVTPLEVHGGLVLGDLAAVENITQEMNDVAGWDDGDQAVLQVAVETASGSAMANLIVVGGRESPALAPGFSGVFAGETVFVEAYSGDERNHWTAHSLADEVRLEVSSGEDGTLMITWFAYWFDRDANGERLETFSRARGVLGIAQ